MAAERLKNTSLKPEMKLNLSAIRKCDQYVIDILDSASQVALYKFNGETQAWVSIKLVLASKYGWFRF